VVRLQGGRPLQSLITDRVTVTTADSPSRLRTRTSLPASRRLRGLIHATRPSQWIKNFTCFAGVIFSGRLLDQSAVLGSLMAFAGFCLAASAVYLFNDVVDRQLDRANPLKRHRPIASGAVPVAWALAAAAALVFLAVSSSLALPSTCLAVLAVYLATNVAYSLRLKHAVLLDVVVIAFGFVLRVLYGVYAVGVKPTAWIVLCMFFLALFLGFAKRRGEMRLMGEEEPSRRPVLAKYRIGFLDMLLVMTAAVAILCYALYTVTGHKDNATLVVTVPLVTYGITRYMLLVVVEGRGEAPEKLLITDRWIMATAGLWVVLCIAIIYTNVNIFSS
jgi:4-hydroxybenzoate polyprenyltransferase